VDAATVRFEGGQECQSPWPLAGRLAIVPRDDLVVIDMGGLDRFGESLVVKDRRMAIRADDEQAAEVGGQAKGVDVKVR
jgi:hypothetical protein